LTFVGGSAGKGVVLSTVTGMSSLLAGLVLLPVVFNTVGVSEYGVWLAILSFVGLIYYLDFGMGTSVVHFLSRHRSGDESISRESVIGNSLVWSVASMALGLVVYGLVVPWYLSVSGVAGDIPEEEARSLLLCGFIPVVGMLSRPFGAILLGLGGLQIERRNQLIGVGLKVVLTLLVCWLRPDIGLLALAESFSLVTPWLLSAMIVVRGGHVRRSVLALSLDLMALQLRFAIRTFSSSLVVAAITQSGTVLVGIYGNAAAISHYAAAFRVYVALKQMMSWITEPFKPVFSRLFVRRDSTDVAIGAVQDLSLLVITLSVVAGGILTLLSEPLVTFWVGDSVPTTEVSWVIKILLAGLMVSSLYEAYVPASEGAGLPGIFLLPLIGILLGVVAVSHFLGPRYGIVGIAIAFSLPSLLLAPWFLRIAASKLGFNASDWVTSALRWIFVPTTILVCSQLTINLWPQELGGGMMLSIGAGALFVSGITFWLMSLRNSETTRRILSTLHHPL
jgi:O-antigen/teichoic acid export membrane protein